MVDEKTISYYLEKAQEKRNEDLKVVLNSNGKINDVDYYVESMRKYYPKGPLVVLLGFEHEDA